MYKYVLNLVVKISLIFAQYFDYYVVILRGRFSVDTVYIVLLTIKFTTPRSISQYGRL